MGHLIADEQHRMWTQIECASRQFERKPLAIAEHLCSLAVATRTVFGSKDSQPSGWEREPCTIDPVSLVAQKAEAGHGVPNFPRREGPTQPGVVRYLSRAVDGLHKQALARAIEAAQLHMEGLETPYWCGFEWIPDNDVTPGSR